MKTRASCCDLKSCFLCKHSSEKRLSQIEVHRENRFFKKGERLFEEGQPVRGIYFLYSGKVKVHKRWGKEKELILNFAKKGDILGHRGLGNKKIYPVTATALEPATVCFVGLPFFEKTLKENHTLTYELLKFYTNELQEAEKRMRDLAHMEVRGRVAEMLLLLKKRFGHDEEGFINISLTRQDMASYAGTTYETVFRVVSDFETDKLIKSSGKKIGIIKETALLHVIPGSASPPRNDV